MSILHCAARCTISDGKMMCHTHYDTLWERKILLTRRDQTEINQIEWETIANVFLQLKQFHSG